MGLSVIRGTGKQSLGAIFTITAFVLLGVPLAYFCGIVKEMGVFGLWIGPTVACAYLTVMYNVLIACIDWNKVFTEIRSRRDNERIEREKILMKEVEEKSTPGGKNGHGEQVDD